jgi:iron-sulfur cluster assembly protein
MSITLSESAARHVTNFIAKRGHGLGIRLGVKTAGCSGFAYKLEFVDSLTEEDLAFVSHGVTIYTDAKSLVYLNGTQLDFVKEGLNEGFKFINPNVEDECGCGESFQVKTA